MAVHNWDGEYAESFTSVNANVSLFCMLEMETIVRFLSKVYVPAVPVIHPVVNAA